MLGEKGKKYYSNYRFLFNIHIKFEFIVANGNFLYFLKSFNYTDGFYSSFLFYLILHYICLQSIFLRTSWRCTIFAIIRILHAYFPSDITAEKSAENFKCCKNCAPPSHSFIFFSQEIPDIQEF